ncbi:MAG: TonB-dependent receptor, partial [Bryobacterales bacterium]|nr:TonB-dependent receptor [Bryobacterales bacterium]
MTILLAPLAAAPLRQGLTDSDGSWCVHLAPGAYVVRAAGRGMEGAARLVTVPPGGQSQQIELSLKVSSLATQVEVTASRLPESLWDAPLPVRQVDRRHLRAVGARQLNDALQEIPEVVTFAGGQHSGGASANVQGFASRDVEILLDGQPLFGRVNGYVDLNQFDASFIEAIEIKTGASAMTYGLQGMGGVIHLLTRRAAEGRHAGFEAGYGSFNTALARAEAGYAARGFALYGAAAMQRGLGYHLIPTAIGKTQPANRVRNVFQSVYLPAWKNWNAASTFLFLDQNFWGFDGSPATGIYDFRRPKRRVILLPRATYTLGGSSLLALRARRIYYRSDEDVVYRAPFSLRGQKTENMAEGGDAEWTVARADGLRFATSLYFNHHRMVGERLTTSGNEASTAVWSQLSTAEVPLASGWRLLAGYRADRDRLFGARLSPQLAVAWRPSDRLSLSGGATRGVRAPDFNEMYIFHTHAGGRVVIYGEPTLRPQRSWSYHAGALVHAIPKSRLETRLFHHDLTDLIEAAFQARQGIASIYRYANIGRARIRGGSANLHYTP